MRRNSPIKRFLAAIVIIVCLLPGGGIAAAPESSVSRPAVSTQEETPLGPGELNISVDADGYHLVETVAAGWYIVTLDNTTQDVMAADLILLPPGKGVDEFQKSLSTENGGSTIPDWFEQVVFAGGPTAAAEQSAQTLVELTPGTWTVLKIGQEKGKTAELVVTEATGPATTPAITASVDMTMGPTTMEMPGQIPTGYQVWRVANTDTLTHAFALVQLPAAVSPDEMRNLLTTGKEPDGVNTAKALVVGGIGLLSGGRTIWTGFDLVPGYYVALDYVPQKDGRTFAELGQFALFIVQ